MNIKIFLAVCLLTIGLVVKAQDDDGTLVVDGVMLHFEEKGECPMSTSCGQRVQTRLARLVHDWLDNKLYEWGVRFPDYAIEAANGGGNRHRELVNEICDTCQWNYWLCVFWGCPGYGRRRRLLRGLSQDVDAELVAMAARLKNHIETKAAEALEVLVANRPELSSSCSCALLALQPNATVYV